MDQAEATIQAGIIRRQRFAVGPRAVKDGECGSGRMVLSDRVSDHSVALEHGFFHSSVMMSVETGPDFDSGLYEQIR
jgi:hypothetical protein